MNSESPTPRRSWLRRLINRLEVDRATFFSIAARVWQLLAGPVSMVLITVSFTPEVQGFYYMFASLMALQGLVELGLHAVIVNVASHEWAQLELGPDGVPAGDARSLSRLAHLARTAFRWYASVAAAFVVLVTIAGVLYFSNRANAAIDWLAPWVALVILTGGAVWLWALTAVLEGCNQVAAVHRVRFLQALTGSLIVWACMLSGAGLWTIVAAALVRVLWDLWLTCVAHRAFFQALWRNVSEQPSLLWWEEVWPLQWRMGTRAIVGYFALNLFVPIMFHYHGAVEAGRMGMTWTALTALEGASFAWVYTRTSVFGMLAARAEFKELNRVFLRLTCISTVILVIGSVAFCCAIAVLGRLPIEVAQKLSDRLLPLGPTAIFCAALCLFHIPKCQSIYILAHKRDPLLIPSLLLTGTTALAVWWGGSRFGAWGESVGYLAVIGLLYLPVWNWIWLRCRREWHGEADVSVH